MTTDHAAQEVQDCEPNANAISCTEPVVVLDVPSLDAGKECNACGEFKPLTAYYRHPRAADGHDSRCIECVLARRRARYQTDDAYRLRLLAYLRARYAAEKAKGVA